MYNANVLKILTQIKEKDIVLDIGGWFYPFNRTNYVIDIMPYETRGRGRAQGGTKEYFSKQTWLQLDVCDRKPLPFRDKEIDFVVCSHTLEDIRDPLFVCSEICRVGKQGYIEVPSKLAELSFGIVSNNYAGYFHHRWIVEIENNKFRFLFKPHFIHSCWKYHFPSYFGKRLKQEERIQWLFWKESFEFEEIIDVEYDIFKHETEEFIKSQHVYPGYLYQLEKIRELLRKTRTKFFR